MRSVCQNAEQLELKCDDLTKQAQDINRLYDLERRKNEKFQQEKLRQSGAADAAAGTKTTESLQSAGSYIESSASQDFVEV